LLFWADQLEGNAARIGKGRESPEGVDLVDGDDSGV
jgi:hypothetical protein